MSKYDGIMTVDLAIDYAQNEYTADSANSNALDVLAAEVKRLQKVVADQARRVDELTAECDSWHQASQQLREEAQTSRLALDVALRALKWFEEREDAVRADAAFSADRAVSDVHKWENENPKPGAAPEVIDEHRRTKALEAVAKRFTLDAKTFFVVDAPQDAGELPPGDKDPEP